MESSASSCWKNIGSTVTLLLEKKFYWYGKTVGKYPVLFIFLCILLTVSCSIGILKFTKENRPFKLWIPKDSDSLSVMEWQSKHFPQKFRIHFAIYEAENILTKEAIQDMFKIHNIVTQITTGKTDWNTTCAKLPLVPRNIIDNFGRKKRDTDLLVPITKENNLHTTSLTREKRQAWWMPLLSRDDYCAILTNSKRECIEHSILEVWGYDENTLNSLTDKKILNDVNNADYSAVFGFYTNFSKLLGGIQKNSEGKIVGAKAAQHVWITEIREEDVRKGEYVDDTGMGMMVDQNGFDWELKFTDVVLSNASKLHEVDFYLMSSSSFGKISGSTIADDAKLFSLGFCVLFIYVQIMLGKFNLVEQRPLLSLLGISSVLLSICVSYGLCSAIGIPYGPVNNILPFLLLGLGVDDMFVIIQTWNNLVVKEKKMEMHERIGLTLKEAGVSVTITSLTDFVAFAIGSTTSLPALRYFCLYASFGIVSIYFFQITYFVAWFTLDQRRLENSRQGLVWCWKLKDWEPNKCSQRDLCQTFFKDFYSKTLLRLPCKILIIICTALILTAGGFGLYNLRQEFNLIWFLPQSSYLYKFFMKREEYFPNDGEQGIIIFSNISIFENLHKMDQLVSALNMDKDISEVDSWYTNYKLYWDNLGFDHNNFSASFFSDRLSEFLHSPMGSKYRIKNFKFSKIINCSDPLPQILASSIEFKHQILYTSTTKIRAMESVKDIVRNMNFSGYVHPWALGYSGWETDKVIEVELYRNMSIALVTIFFMTLVLIASLSTSLMVLLCVVLTLVDVGGLMYWWGLTIDTVSCIDLVLAVGLCVDYAAHIGHTFMTETGSRDKRVENTLSKIGPAVLNGGISTFISILFLAGSDSHVFITFFKVFVGVCLFGLYHGLVFLPVLLSLIGPPPYKTWTSSSPEINPPEVEICLNSGYETSTKLEMEQDKPKESAI